jgi:hypothetical protein
VRHDPADVLMVEDDPGDALIAAVGRLAWCGAVRYVRLSLARGPLQPLSYIRVELGERSPR